MLSAKANTHTHSLSNHRCVVHGDDDEQVLRERESAIDSAVANNFVRQQPNYGGGDGDDLIAVYGSGWPNSEAKIPTTTTGAKEVKGGEKERTRE